VLRFVATTYVMSQRVLMMPTAADLLSVERVGPTVVVALLGSGNGHKFPWGTLVSEHRINPPLIGALNAALDQALVMDDAACVVVTNQGKFFSNGLDLKWIDQHPGDAADAMQASVERLLLRLLTFAIPTGSTKCGVVHSLWTKMHCHKAIS
jgi:hypothetical protein